MQSGGDIGIANDQVLTTLDIDASHATPGVASNLSITSPSLTFAASDDGSVYTLTSIVAPDLQEFSFTGDQGIVAGNIAVASGGSVALEATAGDIVGDGNGGTISAGQVALTSDTGSVGSAAAPIGIATPSLTVATAGNLYIAGSQALPFLDVTSTHADPASVFVFQVTAPGLTFNVTDSPSGYVLGTVTNVDGSTFNFSGDRSIALGNIDLGPDGALNVSVSANTGAITGNGDPTATVIAGSVGLNAPDTIGTSDNPLAVVTGTLSADTTNGGIFVTMPSTIGAGAAATTLGYINAGGPVTVTAAAGDLTAGQIYAQSGDVTLTASAGTVTNAGYIFAGGIDGAPGTITMNSSGSVVTASGSDGSHIYTVNPGGPIILVGGVTGLSRGVTPGVGPVYELGSVVANASGVQHPATDDAAAQDTQDAARYTADAAGAAMADPDPAPGVLHIGGQGVASCGGATTVTTGPGHLITLAGATSLQPGCRSGRVSLSGPQPSARHGVAQIRLSSIAQSAMEY